MKSGEMVEEGEGEEVRDKKKAGARGPATWMVTRQHRGLECVIES